MASVYHAHLTRVLIVRPAAQRTFTLIHTGLLLRLDKYEPHNFCQFGNEQSKVNKGINNSQRSYTKQVNPPTQPEMTYLVE